jgi:hypothetical protein
MQNFNHKKPPIFSQKIVENRDHNIDPCSIIYKHCRVCSPPEANPAIASYNAKSSGARFENKMIFFIYEKRSSLLQRWRCSCKFQSRRIG